jgi:hypothetical protein
MLESPAGARPANARIPLWPAVPSGPSSSRLGRLSRLGPLKAAGPRLGPTGSERSPGRPLIPLGPVGPGSARPCTRARPASRHLPPAFVQRAVRPAADGLAYNVVREIPNVDNFRPLWTASQAKTFSCAQPVDCIIPGRRTLTVSRTRISTAPSPCCAQRGRRVCTGYPQACAQQRWTPAGARAKLSEPSGTTASNGPRGQPRECLPQWGRWQL